MEWKTEYSSKRHDLKKGIFIAGLPGIGNVGKIVSDFLIDELKAEKICEFFSYHMPNSVFINDKNLIEIPKIELYLAKKGNNRFLILSGDTQPIDEIGCFSFCENILDILQENKAKEIITLGGIGLQDIPNSPKVYCTGNDKRLVLQYCKGTQMNDKVFGIVGPVIGVSGVLVGLAEKRKIKAVSILAETFGHPMFLGLKGAREILKVLDIKFALKLDLKNLDKEIKMIEGKMKITEDIGKTVSKKKEKGDVSYIG